MKLCSLVAVVAAALILSATAMSATPKWSHMTLTAKRTFLVQTIQQNRTTVRWWIAHRRALRSAPARVKNARVPIPVCRTIGIRAPSFVCSKANRVRRAMAVLHAIETRLAASAFPPHHALWMCIHGHEGNWDDPNSGGNGHYGGLQMHPGWGYGTSYYANEDSQIVQEQSAERGYRASGYSKTWLLGQWYHPDCLAYS